MAAEALVRGILYCNFRESGWSEVYNLKTTDMLQAEQDFRIIAGLRTAWFGKDVSLVWARVATVGTPRDGLMCQLDFPLGPYPSATSVTNPEDPFTGVMFRFSGANFRWGNRILRGLPDDEISNKDWTDVANKKLLAPVSPLPVWPTTATRSNARKGFLSRIQGSCCFAERVTATTFNKFDILYPIVFRKVTRRATGRPFGTSRGRAPAHAGG